MPLVPHTQLRLDEDPSCSFAYSPLWDVKIFRCLAQSDCVNLIHLAEAHARAQGGWSTNRHKHHPTTDIAVSECTALQATLAPIINDIVLPTMATHYGFSSNALSMRDLFVVKYEAGHSTQDRLRPHRDGNLLSFSLLLSDPSSFDGGGLRFHSVGPKCDFCGGCVSNCPRCDGAGREAICVGQGDLTTHCGKLLHEGVRVLRGTRYVVVGFVVVESPLVDVQFVANSMIANSSSNGKWADHECVGAALRAKCQAVGETWQRPERGGEHDLASQMYGGM